MPVVESPHFCYQSDANVMYNGVLVDALKMAESNNCPIAAEMLDFRWRTSYTLENLANPVQYVSWDTASNKLSFLSEKDYDAIYNAPLISVYHERWSSKRRTELKAGKFAKYMLGKTKFTDSQIEAFTIHLKTYAAKINATEFEFMVIEGEDIRWAYHERNYTKYGSGHLASSCMATQMCQSYFDIYCDNPQSIKMLVALDDDCNVTARSLLWCDNHTPFTYDRVYAATQKADLAMHEYAKSVLGLTSCYRQDSKHIVHIPNALTYYEYPYLDTFCFAYDDSLATFKPKSIRTRTLQETDGGYLDEHEPVYICHDCGEEIYADWTDYATDTNGEVHCTDCCVWSERELQIIPSPDAYYAEDIEDYLFAHNTQYCEATDATISADNAVESDYHGGMIRQDLAITMHNGDWIIVDYIGDDIAYSEYHGEYILMDECHDYEKYGDWIDSEVDEDDLPNPEDDRTPSIYAIKLPYDMCVALYSQEPTIH